MITQIKAFLSRLSSRQKGVLILLIIVLILPLIVWFAQKQQEIRQRASENPLSPPTTGVTLKVPSRIESIPLTQDLPIHITLEAGTYDITGVDFTLSLDNNVFSIASFTPTASFSSVLNNNITPTPGNLRFTATSTNTDVHNSGTIDLGTLVLRPQTQGTANLSFSASQITALGVPDSLPVNYANGVYIVSTVTISPTSVPPTPIPSPYMEFTVGISQNNFRGLTYNTTYTAKELLDQTQGKCNYIMTTRKAVGGVDTYYSDPSKAVLNTLTTLTGGKAYVIACSDYATIRIPATTQLTSISQIAPLIEDTSLNYITVPVSISASDFLNQVNTLNASRRVVCSKVGLYSPSPTSPWKTFDPTLPISTDNTNFTMNPAQGYNAWCTSQTSPTSAPTNTPVPLTTTPISTSTPIPVAGDVNGDASLDILDYNIWRNEFLNVVTTKQSDLNHDNKIDLLDFNLWRTAFQNSVTATTAPTTGPATSSVSITYQPIKSTPNLIGFSVDPAPSLTVQDFLNKTNGSCYQIKDLTGAATSTTLSTALASTAPLVGGKGYAVICDDVYETGYEVVSIGISGRPLTITDIKSKLVSGWQFIAIPYDSSDYTADQFLVDLSNGSGFNCSQIQAYVAYISSVGINGPSWTPSTPYVKGSSSGNFTLSKKAGYKIYCSR